MLKSLIVLINFQLILCFSVAANCKPKTLFDKYGNQVRDYDEIVSALKPGDTIDFGDHKFRIEKILGNGRTTKIVSIGGQKALRFPLKRGMMVGGGDQYTEFIKHYVEGYNGFFGSDISIPQLYLAESNINQFLIVEEINTPFTLYDLIYSLNEAKNIRNKKPYYDAFLKFVESTWQFSKINDFRPDQIGWNQNTGQWILLDFYKAPVKAEIVESDTVFDTYHNKFSGLPDNVKTKIKRLIYARRKEMRMPISTKTGCVPKLKDLR